MTVKSSEELQRICALHCTLKLYEIDPRSALKKPEYEFCTENSTMDQRAPGISNSICIYSVPQGHIELLLFNY